MKSQNKLTVIQQIDAALVAQGYTEEKLRELRGFEACILVSLHKGKVVGVQVGCDPE